MKKLNKNHNAIENTVEAYVSCWCACDTCGPVCDCILAVLDNNNGYKYGTSVEAPGMNGA